MIKFWIMIYTLSLAVESNADYPINISENPAEWTNIQVEEIIGDIQKDPLIALGETVHGSQKFTQAQTRIIQYLVEFRGYRNIYIEDRIFYLEPISQWVRNGTGEIDLMIHDMYWENISAEVLNLLHYLRSWNINHPNDKVEFMPIDVHVVNPYTMNEKIKILLTSINEINNLNKIVDAEKTCIGHDISVYENYIALEKSIRSGIILVDNTKYNLCFSTFDEVLRDIKDKKNQIINLIGIDTFSELVILLQTLPTKQAFFKFILSKPRDIPAFTKVRDPIIAENLITRNQQFGNRPGVLLGHTLHLTKNALLADWGYGLDTLVSAGYYLNNYFKGNYKPFALTGYQVSTSGLASGGYSYELPVASNSIDNYLNMNNYQCTYFKSTDNFLNIYPSWFIQNGNRIQDPNGILLNLQFHFDTLIFFKESKMSTRIPFQKK